MNGDPWPWDYRNHATPFPYGEETSYIRAMAFLDAPDTLIEDWGCGAAWARRYVTQGTYRGVDGGPGYADVVTNLTDYRSTVEAILLRHVLEHNWACEEILSNALASASRRLAIVLFTPLGGRTMLIGGSQQQPDLSLNRGRLEAALGSRAVREEEFPSETQYGREIIFYVEQP